jgi:hypothetical protein
MWSIILAELAEALTVEVGCTVITKLIDQSGSVSHGQIQLLSNVPGRTRMKIPAVKKAPDAARRVEDVLRAQPWVHRVTANPVTGTVLVNYEKTGISPRFVEEIARLALSASLYERRTAPEPMHRRPSRVELPEPVAV